MNSKWLLILVIFVALTGCSNKEKTVVEHEEKPSQVEGTSKELYAAPLSGVKVKEESTNRAYAVMINNDPKARPQSGLHKADIVYELLAEGNVTRFLAVFQSEDAQRIGPVRSARDYYIELAKGYDALYIAHGYSPEAKEMLGRKYIDSINGMQYDGTLFKRDHNRVAPHNSYISSENILKGAKKLDYDMDISPKPLSFLTDKELEGLNGEQAHSALISYFSSSLFDVLYTYDEKKEKYTRTCNDEVTMDSDSKEPVLLDNIFIVETAHAIMDEEGRRKIDLTSGGAGYLLQKGQWKSVQWKNVNGRILPYENGESVGFVPGKTWINIVPTGQGLDNIVTFNRD